MLHKTIKIKPIIIIGEYAWGGIIMSHINEHCITIILNIISLIVVIIGGIFAFVQWKKSLMLKKAEYIKELIDKIRSDPEIREVIYTFDYVVPWYGRKFHGSETEKK